MLSHSMVHYLLTIHKLKEVRGFARVTDIAKDLKLTKGSVSTAINNLKKRALVSEEEDCKFLVLTEEGHSVVHKILSSRLLLYHFLKDVLNVSDSVAKHDACLMEHLISSETCEKFFLFMKKSSCSCEDTCDCAPETTPKYFAEGLKTELELCDYKCADDFIDEQKPIDLLKD